MSHYVYWGGIGIGGLGTWLRLGWLGRGWLVSCFLGLHVDVAPIVACLQSAGLDGSGRLIKPTQSIIWDACRRVINSATFACMKRDGP